jgi:2',3'-cyclic-nucleotide 2'-phosphodiesterase/3'-nucleotidase
MSQAEPTRRTLLTGAAALAAAGFVPGAADAATRHRHRHPDRTTITVLGTTDTHGHVFNWDYFANKEYDDSKHNDVGLAKIATLVEAMRKERGRRRTLLIDAGDTIQGTPLAYYYARIDPITEGAVHPMAEAMNLIGYDAAALGNHEFNYGIPLLRKFEEQCDFPLLAANAVDPVTKRPAFRPYVIKTLKDAHGRPVRVGILGLTNPGIAIWDKANVEGKMEFPGLVEQASIFVPRLRREGVDVVVVAAHSGPVPGSSYGDALPYPENAARQVAEEVPGIDAILVGHAHLEVPELRVTNKHTGKEVVLTEPLMWAERLSVLSFELEMRKGRWHVVSCGAQLLNSNTAAEDAAVVAALTKQHEQVVDYVNTPIGTCTVEMPAARAVVEDVPIIDFINYVQADAVKQALAGTADAALPVLSIAAPFSRTAVFPKGDVSVRDVAGLYIYDNTLLGVKITGAQVKEYLEWSARYFKTVTGTSAKIQDVTNAVTDTAASGTPDYNYDIVAGLVDDRLTYDIDLAEPASTSTTVGSRIKNLSYKGAPIDPAQEFVLAINNYRQSGGGGFPAVKTAEVVYNRQVEIRQLLIDWVTANQVIDPTKFARVDWKLVSNGQDLTVTDS